MESLSSSVDRSDELLVACIANGDHAALASLYDRHAGRLLAFAHWLGLTSFDAQDVVHDVFLEMWHYAGEFDPSRGSARTWMLVRLRSRIVDHLRKVNRRKISAEDDLDTLSLSSDSRSNVDRHLHLRRRLATLSLNQQQVIILAFLEGFSYDEIARHLAIPFGTVKSRLSSALAKLREKKEEGT